MRVVCATGCPDVDAAVAACAGVEVVGTAYYVEAACTVVDERAGDTLLMAADLPGGRPEAAAAELAARGVRVLWLLPDRAPGPPPPGSVPVPAPWTPERVRATLREPVPPRCAREAPPRGMHVWVGCLPRVGLSTAAAAYCVTAARSGTVTALIEANADHPELATVLGLAPAERSWTSATPVDDLARPTCSVAGVDAWLLAWDPASPPDPGLLLSSLNRLAPVWARYDLVCVDLGAPRPICDGRVQALLDWGVRHADHVDIVFMHDRMAMAAAERVLRTIGSVRAVEVSAWLSGGASPSLPGRPDPPRLSVPWAALPWDRSDALAALARGGLPRFGGAGAAGDTARPPRTRWPRRRPRQSLGV